MERCPETLPFEEFFNLNDAEILKCSRERLEANATTSYTEQNGMLHDIVLAYHRDREEISEMQMRALFDWGYEVSRKDWNLLPFIYPGLRNGFLHDDWTTLRDCLRIWHLPEDFTRTLRKRTQI